MEQKGEILIYRSKQGNTKIDVRLENESIWLTQQQMADLFQTTKQNISLHLINMRIGRKFNCQGFLDSSRRRKAENK